MVSQNKIRKLIRFIYEYLQRKNNADIFSVSLLKKFKLPHYLDALKYCHFPESCDFDKSNLQFELGRQRFILEELLAYKLMLINAKKKYQTNRSHKFIIDDSASNAFIESLPFKLTQSQQNAIGDIRHSLNNTYPTKRLIQGDVGSGKTVIAAVAAHYAIMSNLQVAILVPTEILADQHHKTFKQIFSDLSVKISCIKSKIKGKAKTSLLDSISHGDSNIVIGTHALIEDNVIFKNLGLVIIDEQHKFGIKQRVKLSSNNTKDIYPHEIYLSATPIPRSLSLVLYEGLDYTVVAQMPQGRKTIITKILSSSSKDKLYEHISNTLLSNEQIYWVCSCIDFTESLELEYVAGIFDLLTEKFPSHNIAVLHGRNDTRENNKTMSEFINGKIDILVCTTMIEVGIDVPNATCIVIEDSNRFGLSQLHQLRGRVGRSSKQSYCYLICKEEVNDNAMRRLIALEKHSNGFNIA
jgi:ATP-dependent DNA helicase RecG